MQLELDEGTCVQGYAGTWQEQTQQQVPGMCALPGVVFYTPLQLRVAKVMETSPFGFV
jgi:hypothetical protein